MAIATLAPPLFDGRFELLEPLGQGGMASVHVALDHREGRRVALKRLDPQLLRDPSSVDLFEQEGSILARLHMGGVPRLHAIGVGGRQPYIAMQRVQGEPLGAYVGSRFINWREVVRLVGHAAELLERVHQAGVVHRDITPENILVCPDRQVWLIDFGVASPIGLVTPLEEAGIVHGTLGYVSPERFTELPYTNQPAGDVYALGVVLYELLAGRLPFAGGGATEVLQHILEGEVVPLERYRPELGAVSELLRRAMAEDPARRPASAGALASELYALADRPRPRRAG